jgi:hypothetical protein
MNKTHFKHQILALFSCLLFLYPLSISAAIYQKQTNQNQMTFFENKLKTKQSFFQKILHKRIEKVIKKHINKNFEQERPNQTLGLIALIMLFVGVVLLLLTSGIGFLFIFSALILSIVGLATEESPTFARRSFWLSLLITLYFFAKLFKVF